MEASGGAVFTGDRLLKAAFGVSLALLLALVANEAPPAAFLALPVAALGLFTAPLVLRHPQLNFALVIGLSVLTVGNEAGIQLTEVFYGLYYLSYLAGWFLLRLVVYREPLTEFAGDRAMLLFLVGVVLSTVWAFLLFDATLADYVSGMQALAFLGFYFPVREACLRWEKGPHLVLGLFFWITLFIALRNLATYQEQLASAVLAEYIRNRRVSTNSHLLMAGAVMSMALLVHTRRWLLRAALAGMMLLQLVGLIITLSRSSWVVTAFGFFLVAVLGKPQARRQALVWMSVGGLVLAGLLFVIAGDKLGSVVEGMMSRLGSITNATTRDLSLISRFYETQGVQRYIFANPVLGYGVGVTYEFFDIISQATVVRAFSHNGYFALWYRFGLWGPLLIGTAWLGAIRRGLLTYWQTPHPTLPSAMALGVATALLCFTIATYTANPFHNDDSLFFFALLTGAASGLYARSRRALPVS